MQRPCQQLSPDGSETNLIALWRLLRAVPQAHFASASCRAAVPRTCESVPLLRCTWEVARDPCVGLWPARGLCGRQLAGLPAGAPACGGSGLAVVTRRRLRRRRRRFLNWHQCPAPSTVAHQALVFDHSLDAGRLRQALAHALELSPTLAGRAASRRGGGGGPPRSPRVGWGAACIVSRCTLGALLQFPPDLRASLCVWPEQIQPGPPCCIWDTAVLSPTGAASGTLSAAGRALLHLG